MSKDRSFWGYIVLLPLLFTFLSFSSTNNVIVTLRVSAFPDSAKVQYFAAALFDSNGVQRDSLYSGNTNEVAFINVPTSMQQNPDNLPSQFSLAQNYPNPFNPTTRIRFQVPKAGPVSLKTYTILGQEEASLEMRLQAGTYEVEYRPAGAAGVRFYRIEAGDFTQTKKMVNLGGAGGNASMRLVSSGGAVYNQDAANENHSLAKTSAGKYSVRIMNLPSTTPQIVDTLIQIMSLERDTTINVYLRKAVNNKENITAYVYTSDDSSHVKNYLGKLKRKDNGSIVDSMNSGNSNMVKFSNVDKGIEYLLQVVGSDSTKPMITTQDFAVVDTIVNAYAQRFLKPAALNPVPNVSMKEDIPPADSLIALLSGKGYDRDGNQVPDSMLTYQIIAQSDTGLVYLVPVGNKIKLARLKQDGNGFSDVTARILAPNGRYADQSFRATVTPMRDVNGTLTDYENKPQIGYVMLINAAGDSVIAKTDSTGKFALQTNPTLGDTIKAHIIRPGRNEAFVRTIYVPGGNDVSNQVVDAVPLLPETFYVGADTVVSWLVEGNFEPLPNGMNYWGLKKVDLNNMKEVITSINANSGDTMKVVEQQRLMNVVQTDVDPLFKNKPTYYVVPQDSATQRPGYSNSINHFKDGRVSNATLTSWDDNNDGILEGGGSSL